MVHHLLLKIELIRLKYINTGLTVNVFWVYCIYLAISMEIFISIGKSDSLSTRRECAYVTLGCKVEKSRTRCCLLPPHSPGLYYTRFPIIQFDRALAHTRACSAQPAAPASPASPPPLRRSGPYHCSGSTPVCGTRTMEGMRKHASMCLSVTVVVADSHKQR